MRDATLVVVKSFGSRAEALLAKSVLESAGIPAMTQADTAGGMREHLAWSGAGFQVWVREEDATAAGKLLTPKNEGNETPDADVPEERDSRPPSRRFT